MVVIAASRVTARDGKFYFSFPYSPYTNSVLKSLFRARWDPNNRWWWADINIGSIAGLTELVTEHGFELDESVQEILLDVEDQKEASMQLEADFNVEGLGMELYPFQKAGVAYAVKNKKVLIADSMGLGKTPQALATIKKLDAFPALVITTATQKMHWVRETEKWLPGVSVDMANGEVPKTDVVVINYDLIERRCELLGVEKKETPVVDAFGEPMLDRKRKPKIDVEYIKRDSPYRAIILDESHKVKSPKALRTQMALTLCKDVDTIIELTGSPMVNRPAELISQLRILDRLDDVGGWSKFVHRYCDAYRDRFGYHIEGASNLEELDSVLRASCMVRRDKREVFKELPAKQRVVIPFEITNTEEYEEAQAQVIRWLWKRAYAEKEFLDSIAELPEEQQQHLRAEHANSAAERAAKAEELVKLNALKRLVAYGKLVAAGDWIEDFLESGEKLIVFAWHKDVQANLIRRFEGRAAQLIAEDSALKRDENIRRFQEDPECKVIICSLQAGAEGWTGTAASNVAFVELGWTPGMHEQAEDRCYGRMNDMHGATAWYLLGADTIDEWLAELIESKRDVINTGTGSKGDGGGSIIEGLKSKLMRGDELKEEDELSPYELGELAAEERAYKRERLQQEGW